MTNSRDKRGVWRFEHLDKTVGQARESGIQLSPILDYNVSWAHPAHENLDAWRRYVTKVVRRYKDDISAWEVWNEPNLGQFWRNPDPGVCKVAQGDIRSVKRVDVNALVVFGGTARVDTGFIKGAYEAGAAGHFDVMAVHPYCHPAPPKEGISRESLPRPTSSTVPCGAARWLSRFVERCTTRPPGNRPSICRAA